MTPGPRVSCFIPIAGYQSNRPILNFFIFLSVLLGMVATTTAWADDDEIDIDRATWSSDRDRLTVRGDNVPDFSTVTIRYGEKDDDGAVIGTARADDDGEWTFRISGDDLGTVPCDVTAEGGGDDDDKEVRNAPNNCSNDGGAVQPPPGNDAPVLAPIGDKSVTVNNDLTFTVTASDDGQPDNTLTLSASNLPAGATFTDNGNGSGNFDWTNASPAGSTDTTFTVSDGDLDDSETITITVADTTPPGNNAPVCAIETPAGNVIVNVDETVNYTATVTDADNNDPLTISWSFGGGSPASSNAEDPGTVNYNSVGVFTTTLNASDGQAGCTQQTRTITVQDNNVPPPVTDLCPDPVPTTLPDAHDLCTTPYTGPEVCVQCHVDEARHMHGSVHYQQNGPADFVSNIEGLGGERGFDFAATGINTYCGSHENSPRFTCAGCHVGNGRFPMEQSQFEALPEGSQAEHDQLANIDCLMCHQELYRRFPNWLDANGNVDLVNLFEPLTLENVTLDGSGNLVASPGDTVVRTGLEGIPVVDPVTDDFEFAPAGALGSINFELPAESPFAPMTVTTEVAAQTVHRTTRRSCLICHAGAAGADGAKRGDLTSQHANPDIGLDQHMSPAGANMTCSDCHSVAGDNGESHRVRGRGLDLRPNDVAERFTCENSGCHSDTPHSDFDFNSPTEDTHAVKVACQTCHIPTYGKGIATETSRDWQDPHLSQSACNGRGGWLPREDKGADLTPSYAWYDGTSEVYYMGEPVDRMPTVPLAADVAQRFGAGFNTGDPAVVLGAPNAIIAADGTIDMTLGVNNPGAKLQAMKEHWGKLALNTTANPDTLIGHSTYDFFRTGDFDLAVRSGLAQDPSMDVNDSFTVEPVHTYQTLNHGVETRGSALSCNNCHRSLSANSRIDLMNDYGYGLRTGTSAVNGSNVSGTLNGDLDLICRQCHGNETNNSDRSFTEVHNRHVAGRSRDCASCHNFSRLDVRNGLNLNN